VPLELEAHNHAGLAAALAAGAARLPFGVLRGYTETDLAKHTPAVRFIDCPFTGEKIAAVRAVNPDVTIIHAQRADTQGNVQLWGIIGIQKEAVLAAKTAIVTVEEICDRLEPVANSVILPSWVLASVVQARRVLSVWDCPASPPASRVSFTPPTSFSYTSLAPSGPSRRSHPSRSPMKSWRRLPISL